jgi:valyl-tRNA synthetase
MKGFFYLKGATMSPEPLPKVYEFAATEQRIYEWWEKSGFFKPVNDPKKPGFDPSVKPFVISIPPPNVTGILHLGHALFVSLEDLMIRYHRMKGIPTLWVPGTDHAGIATQLQVERLLAEEGLTREQVGRDEFVRRAWAWKEKFGGIITRQIRRLGASCDWDRERFTLDEGLSKAVREAFVRLYEKGLVYRGPRLINWSPGLRTAVSDLEVEYAEEPGFLYYFKYVLADNPEEFIPVATTRPETILGDTAVAVHPDDERYQKFIGRKVLVPILGRAIPVIGDEYVDREFGTGALKVTPGHDPNDYAIGNRHGLEIISIMDEAARINVNGGPYCGMDRFDCRKKLWEDMRAHGLVIKEESYTLNVPRTQRGGEVVEPMISTQWFVRIKPLADAALEAVRDGRIRIVPEFFTKVYFNWLENIEDWCISRQLWWGHRIPVWYCDDCGAETVMRSDPGECPKCHSKKIRQDPDVLDTWFSSGLWPFSTLGWPEETPDLKYFYPTSYMETGYDILFFWVARMIMMGLEFTHQAPFHTVYLHGLIRDEFGQKISKSKNNMIDPLEVMDEMGTDALRFTLLIGSTPGNDTNVSVRKVEGNRNFANKIWNAGRFVIGAISQAPENPAKDPDWTSADRWIRARLRAVIRDVEYLFQTFQYGEAGRQIYDFFWSEYADWYVEIAKLQLAEGGDRAHYTAHVLAQVLDTVLRLLHPFAPFVTEELWGHLKRASMERSSLYTPDKGWEEALILAHWPMPEGELDWEKSGISEFTFVQDVIRTIRNLRAENRVTPGKRIPAALVAGKENLTILKSQARMISSLAHLEPSELSFMETAPEKTAGQVSMVVSGVEIYLFLAEMVDVASEQKRLQKELENMQSQVTRLEKLLASDFANKAPAAVVEKERQKLATFKESEAKLHDQLEALK